MLPTVTKGGERTKALRRELREGVKVTKTCDEELDSLLKVRRQIARQTTKQSGVSNWFARTPSALLTAIDSVGSLLLLGAMYFVAASRAAVSLRFGTGLSIII